LILLLVSKLALISVPFIFNSLVDELNNEGNLKDKSENEKQIENKKSISMSAKAFILLPTSLVLMYVIVRSFASATNELRDVIFSKVSQTAIRVVAKDPFSHLYNLDLSFHLSRQTTAFYFNFRG